MARAERKARFGVAGLLGPEIEELLHTAPGEIADATESMHAADLAEVAEDLEIEDRAALLNQLPPERAAEVIGYLPPPEVRETLGALDPERAALVLRDMSPDERADAVASLDREHAEAYLARLSRAEREETRRLLAYPENSAGGLMTPEFVGLGPDDTVAQALAKVRALAAGAETIYALYVVDATGRLVGVLSLRDLLVAPETAAVREVMREELVSARVESDQEEVANLISKYDLLALPVVDASNRMLGIVTVDDVLDVLVEESTEDIQKIGAVAPLVQGYFQSSFWEVAKSRAGWLALLFVGSLVTTSILEYFETSLRDAVYLVFFLPLIMATGGNSGSQSSTLIIRGLSLGDVDATDAGRVALREAAGGLVMGSALGLVAMARAILGAEPWPVAAVIGGTVVGVVVAGSVIGGLLPFAIRRLGLDPAVASAPLVSSLLDVVTITLYFAAARLALSV
jgi:magnesium transporter